MKKTLILFLVITLSAIYWLYSNRVIIRITNPDMIPIEDIANPTPPTAEIYLAFMQSQKPESITDKIKQAFPDNPDVMLAIAKAESGLKPEAINTNTNGSIDVGIFQVNSIHGYDKEKLKNIDYNIECAKKIYQRQGLSAWSVYNNKKYLSYL